MEEFTGLSDPDDAQKDINEYTKKIQDGKQKQKKYRFFYFIYTLK